MVFVRMHKDIRDAFFDDLYEQAKQNKNVVFITADADAFSLEQFKLNLPEQFINVGVAEQNMMLVAAGLALSGKKVFVYSITPFVVYRSLEQIKVILCSMSLDVNIVGLGCGFSFAFDGPTHHAVNDIGVIRSISEMDVFSPCDELSSRYALKSCMESNGPTYIRLDKGVYDPIYTFSDNCSVKALSSDYDIKVISMGYMMQRVINVANELKKVGCGVDVINVACIRQSIKNDLRHLIAGSRVVFVVEENYQIGALGSFVSDMVLEYKLNIAVVKLGLRSPLHLSYGTREWQIDSHLMSTQEMCGYIQNEVVE